LEFQLPVPFSEQNTTSRRDTSIPWQDHPGKSNHMRKLYEKPAATKLTVEQAKLRLLGRTIEGDQAAMEFLQLMFPEPRLKRTEG
jgi:hypothetical protein